MNSMRGWHLQSARTLPVIVVPLGLAVLLGAAGCTDSPESLDQREQAVISDAVHGPEASRVAGFYFLPPVVRRPAMRGAFVPEVSPTVQIDRIDPATGATLRAIATFTRTGDHDGAAIRVRRQGERCEGDDEDGAVDDPDGYFWVRWRTRGLHLSTDAKYRIRVRVPGGRELGFADVRVVDRERDRRAIDRNEFVALRRDHALMIRFRIDRPAVDGDGDGVFDWDDNCPTVANADQRDSVGDHVGDACRCLGVSCAASDACHLPGTCSPTTGVCSNPATPDGTPCGADQVCRAAACVSLALPPRLIAPLSTATVTSRRPTLRWALGGGTDGARVEVCRDRACETVVASFDVLGASGAPAADLPAGVLFWRTRGRAGASTGTSVSPTWQFTVGARSAPVNTSWGTTLDVNGDGFADVVVGAPNAHGNAGAAYLYLGGGGGLATAPAASLSSPNPTGFSFGRSVSSAGDVNGDGYGDLIIGGYGEQALVYLGSARGLVEAPASTLTVPENGYFGSSVAGAGDINGDGYADVVVGAPLARSLGRPLAGQAYVFLGSAGGVATTPATTVPGTGGEYGQFGITVVGVGDVNGDGYGDVVINALFGPAHVYLGGAAGLATEPATALLGLVPQGVNVAGAGDVNGDGYADVLTAAPYFGNSTGVVSLFLGSAAGLPSTPATTLSGPDSVNGAYGTSIASAGDVDGDGYAEIAIGAPGATSATGRVHVYFGGAGGLVTTHVNSPTGLDGPNGYFGTSLAGAGDVNGDGHADLVVGAYPVNAYTGRAYLFAGGAAGVPSLPATTLIGPDGPDGWFGIAVASAEDRRGRAHRAACSGCAHQWNRPARRAHARRVVVVVQEERVLHQVAATQDGRAIGAPLAYPSS